MAAALPLTLDALVTSLAGVGPERATQLGRLKIVTVGDLLLHRPARYEDRRHVVPIRDVQLGVPTLARGRIVAQGVKYWRQRQQCRFELVLEDGTGRLHCRWWNAEYMQKYFQVGDELVVYGKPIALKPRTMDHPEVEPIEGGEGASIHVERIVPVYPLTQNLPQRWLRSLLWRTLEGLADTLATLPDPLLDSPANHDPLPMNRSVVAGSSPSPPAAGREGWGEGGTLKRATHGPLDPAQLGPELSSFLRALPSRGAALRALHFPAELPDATLARRRLALDEFFEFQLIIQTRRQRLEANAPGLPCGGDNHLLKPFLAALGFDLTAAQTRVLREIRQDLRGGRPMRRLLQGDVGSGKTVVAACTILMVLESGHSAALMAPTEILAEQHALTFRRWLEPQGLAVHLQTASHKETQEPEAAATGQSEVGPAAQPTLIIGTHALLEAGVSLPNLGLVIIDEQHKFGVTQREQLVRKGRYPHLLVMTATPIPRTLGLTLYGDLDCSVIDQLPAGRGRIRTFLRELERLPQVYAFIRQQLTAGRQAYVVYSRVEETDQAAGLKAVKDQFDLLQHEFSSHRVGLLHGRLRSEEKEAVMAGFRSNQLHVLLATSIIEVGVDVPNATVMLIENAEQFGLAQLHQLRGRIGRGAHESYCILVANLKTKEARQRLTVMEQTSDGFRIADADLKLRGPGEFLGTAQSGLPTFRFGELGTDLDLIEHARQLARWRLQSRPD